MSARALREQGFNKIKSSLLFHMGDIKIDTIRKGSEGGRSVGESGKGWGGGQGGRGGEVREVSGWDLG